MSRALRFCCGVSQDLSYLQQHNYAALMRSWLGRAQTLNPILSAKNMTLKEYCNATQAQHSFLQPQQHASTETGSSSSSNRAEREGFDEVSDVYITYQGNADFERLGRELPPMLYSVSGGVSVLTDARQLSLGSMYACRCGMQARRVVASARLGPLLTNRALLGSCGGLLVTPPAFECKTNLFRQ